MSLVSEEQASRASLVVLSEVGMTEWVGSDWSSCLASLKGGHTQTEVLVGLG